MRRLSLTTAFLVSSPFVGVSHSSNTTCVSYENFMRPIAAIQTPSVLGMERSGDLVFVLSRHRIDILDVSDSPDGTLVGTAHFVSNPIDMSVDDGVVCLSTSEGLDVFDVSDPRSPVRFGPFLNGWGQVAVRDGYAYLSSGNELQVVDVSDPSSPIHRRTVELPLPIVSLTPAEDALWVGWGQDYVDYTGEAYFVDGASLLSLADPSNPAVEFGFYASSLFSLWGINKIVATPDRIIVTSQVAGLMIFDWRGYLIGHLTVFAKDVVVHGDRAFIAGNGVQVVDLSDPARPQIIGEPISVADQVVLVNETLYAGSGSGVEVHDVAVETTPSPLSHLTVRENVARKIATDGKHAYVTRLDELTIYDIQDLERPERRAILDVDGGTIGVAVRNARAFVTATTGLHVVDVSTPSEPRITATLAGNYRAVGASDHALVVADAKESVHVVELRDDGVPLIVGTVEGVPRPLAVNVEGTLAYVATGDELITVDVEDLHDPRIVSWFAIDTSDVAVRGNHLYLIGRRTLRVVDRSRPESPVIISSTPVVASNSIALYGSNAYLGSWAGLTVVDVSDVHTPRIIGGIGGETAQTVAVEAVRGGVLAAFRDFKILPTQCRPKPVRAPALAPEDLFREVLPDRAVTDVARIYPNPFRSQATISFSTTEPGRFSVKVYDIRGRLIRGILEGDVPAGDHEVVWDGLDEQGMRAAAGTYFLRLSGLKVHTERLVLLGD